jgi:hypothetical protein
VGERPGERAGESVSSAGDVNGDGVPDMIVGCSVQAVGFARPRDTAWLRAARTSFSARVGARRVSSTAAAELMGPARAELRPATPVSSAGDEDGDGFDDIIVGAWWAGDFDEGAAYVLSGARF